MKGRMRRASPTVASGLAQDRSGRQLFVRIVIICRAMPIAPGCFGRWSGNFARFLDRLRLPFSSPVGPPSLLETSWDIKGATTPGSRPWTFQAVWDHDFPALSVAKTKRTCLGKRNARAWRTLPNLREACLPRALAPGAGTGLLREPQPTLAPYGRGGMTSDRARVGRAPPATGPPHADRGHFKDFLMWHRLSPRAIISRKVCAMRNIS